LVITSSNALLAAIVSSSSKYKASISVNFSTKLSNFSRALLETNDTEEDSESQTLPLIYNESKKPQDDTVNSHTPESDENNEKTQQQEATPQLVDPFGLLSLACCLC
jgi:outer membrane biosynthesis protein TonB